jgi:hypothetical protein
MIEMLHAVLVDTEVREEQDIENFLLKHFTVASYWYN